MAYDFERGAKVAGSKFYFTTGQDAWREWMLMTSMITWHMRNGYEFVIPPYIVNVKTAKQAGILPRFDGQFYEMYGSDPDGEVREGLLIPTAETPMVGFRSDEIIPEAELPLKYVCFSPCFRREAGSHGARDKGLRRVHQFHKIELFVICKPEDSERLHQEMLQQVRDMIEHLYPGLVHRVVELPEHDRSPVSAKTYDIELRVGEDWLEVSSISNTLDNQTKPAQVRYRPAKGGKPVKCHMLNGSGLALPRLVLALDATKSHVVYVEPRSPNDGMEKKSK